MTPLPLDFYLQDTTTLARELIGKRLVHVRSGEQLVVEITETEAYLGISDKACHSYGGRRTPRTETLYLRGGHSYIYLIYGMHCLFNVVSEAEENPCAVLVRGATVISGENTISRLRTGKTYDMLTSRQKKSLLDGPGKFSAGLGLTREQNATDMLSSSELYICDGTSYHSDRIMVGKRIGIDYAEEDADLPLRFFLSGK